MKFLTLPMAALAWLGRQGTRALAVSIFLGLAVPQLAASVKPFLGETVFVLLLFSYLRTDPEAFRRVIKAPRLAILASLWVMVALPLVLGLIYAFSGIRETMPALYTILILQVAITPITSAAAFAALMGLDVALSLFALILCNVLSPVTTVAFSYAFLGASMISPLELGFKLFLFFGGAGVIAWAIRRIAGQRWIEAQKQPIDGLNVIGVFVFAIVAMESVPRNFMADPLFALGLLGFIVALTVVLLGLTLLVFARSGRESGLVIGLLASCRNLGVVMAALGASLPELAWFFFGLVQFPIYLFPALLKPLARRFEQAR
jgi:BASS family bile acid:Na+ symporter